MVELIGKKTFPGGSMKRIVSLLMTLVMLFGVVTTLASCGAPKDDGAEINIYLGAEVFDFDPSDYYVSANAEQVLSLIYEPLFTISDNGKLQYAGAKKYKVDKEERKIIIDIRESYWSDNIKVVAADYVYAWCNRIIDSSTANPAAALFTDIEGVKEAISGEANISDVGIKATEMDQITITYCEGADYKRILTNLASVAASPVRQSVVETAETYWSKYTATIVTNGPFKLKNYDRENGTFELTRNLGYHQNPTVKDYDNNVNPGLIYGTFTSGDSEIAVSYNDIKSKVVFVMADASLAERKEFKKKADTAEHTSVYTYVFNTANPLFADVNVRLALSCAIDRNAIIEAITFGKAADGFVPDVSGGSKDKLISTGADMNKAKDYLAKATTTAEKSFTLTIDSDEQSKAIADIAVAAWTELGFNVTLKVAEPVETTLSNGTIVIDSGIQYLVKDASYGKVNYDVIAVDWQTYSLDAAAGLTTLTSNLNGMGKDQFGGNVEEGTSYYSVARKNIAGWSDSEYDALVAAALAATNKKDRAAKLAEAESYLISQMPVCPLVFNESFVFTGSKISKLEWSGLGNLVFTDVKLGSYKKFLKPEEE